jgi:hypothetical protein
MHSLRAGLSVGGREATFGACSRCCAGSASFPKRPCFARFCSKLTGATFCAWLHRTFGQDDWTMQSARPHATKVAIKCGEY